jgi:hypothetical protein
MRKFIMRKFIMRKFIKDNINIKNTIEKFLERIFKRLLLIYSDGGISVFVVATLFFGSILLGVIYILLINIGIVSLDVVVPNEEIPILVNNEVELDTTKPVLDSDMKKKVAIGTVITVVAITICVGVAFCYGFDLNFFLVC